MIYQIFTFAFEYIFLVSYKVLDIFDNIISTAVPTAKASVWGHHEHCTSPRSPIRDDLNEMKRIKLLLDISVTPGPSGVVVSSTKITNMPVTTSIKNKIFWLPAYCMLKGSFMTRKILKFLEVRILSVDSYDGEFTLSKIDDSNRKIISPKKRVKTPRSLWRRVLPKFFPFSLLRRGSSGIFEFPKLEFPDTDDLLNNSRLKAVEKRKRSTSDIDYDNSSNPSSSVSSSHKVAQNGNRSSSEIESEDQVNEKEKVAEQHTSGNSSCARLLFDVDDDYKSADDPDYCPSEEESSSSEDASDEEGEIENIDNSDVENNENGAPCLSPATSTTEMHPAGESNRRGSFVLEDENLGSPPRQNENDSTFSLPGTDSAFDSPHSTTSYDDDNDTDV